MFKNKPITFLGIGVLFCLYFYQGYFLVRTNFNSLLVIWIILFATTYWVFLKKKTDFLFLAGIAILFRLVFLIAIPNLSQDFYRFIWDGRMLLEGYNPYLSLPKTLIENGNAPIQQASELYTGMGEMNGSHYTNYPPINQLCFFIAALLSESNILGSVVVMRLLIIASDIGIIFYGKKLLEKLQLPTSNIFLYALNPFIIIELTGNLHFESVMLFFLVVSFYYLYHQKWIWSAIFLAFSVSVKLIPLLFLPLYYTYFTSKQNAIPKRIKKTISFYGITLGTITLLFIPFLSIEFISNYSNSVGLWFKNFEFNASIYYIAREIGYLFRGYNEIAIIGKILPILTIIFLLFLTFYKKINTLQEFIKLLLFGITFYYFTATTMHPWYIATLVILCVFTNFRFPILWSFLVILSYQAYANIPWKENLWLITIEYLLVYLLVATEIKYTPGIVKKKLTSIFMKI